MLGAVAFAVGLLLVYAMAVHVIPPAAGTNLSVHWRSLSLGYKLPIIGAALLNAWGLGRMINGVALYLKAR